MRKIVLMLTLPLFFYSSLLHTLPYQGPPTPSMIEKNMAKKSWMSHIENTLPGLLCDPNQYFMQCFNVKATECIEFTQMFVQACLNNVALGLPDELDSKQGKYWGQIIGRCSYDLYEKFMQPKKRDLTSCKQTNSTNAPSTPAKAKTP